MTLTTINKPYFSPVSVIKSIQRGELYVPSQTSVVTNAIAAVDLSKSVLVILGTRNADLYGSRGQITIELTNSTTITAKRDQLNGDSFVNWEVIEYV